MVDMVDHVQKETVAWARAGQVADLPSVALATSLLDAFEEQRVAISLIQQDIEGSNPPVKLTSTPLISDGELAALMR